MSVAYLQHPVTYVTGYQYASNQQLMAPRQHFQMMWQARSMESGLGRIIYECNCDSGNIGFILQIIRLSSTLIYMDLINKTIEQSLVVLYKYSINCVIVIYVNLISLEVLKLFSLHSVLCGMFSHDKILII